MPGLGKFIGGIKFGVSMDTRKLNKSIKSARKMIGGFVGSVKTTTLAIGGLSGAIGAVGFAKFTSDAFKAIDSLAKVSDKLGISTEALAGLRLAATESGVATNTLDMALQRMVRRVAEAAQGTSEARGALKALGLNAKQLAKLTPDKQLLEIADAMNEVRSAGEQVRLSFKLFDSEGVALVSTLRQGRKAIEQTTRDAKALGLAVSRESARGVERAIDAFNRFKAAIGGIFRSVAIEIAPVIEGLSDKLTGFLISGGKAKTAGRAIGDVVVKMAKVVADGAQRAFAAMLRMAAVGIDTFNQLRSSRFAQSFLGLEAPSESSLLLGINLRKKASRLEKRENLPSTLIDEIIFKNLKAVAKEQRKPNRALALAKGVGGNLLGQGRNFLAGFGQGGRGIANLPLARLLPTFLTNFFQAGHRGVPAAAATSSSGFAPRLAEAGSAEALRKRAEILNRQSGKDKLGKERNQLLKEIKEGINKPCVELAPANLGGF